MLLSDPWQKNYTKQVFDEHNLQELSVWSCKNSWVT